MLNYRFCLNTIVGREIIIDNNKKYKVIYETKQSFYLLKDGKIIILPKNRINNLKIKCNNFILVVNVRYLKDRIWERVKSKIKPKWRL